MVKRTVGQVKQCCNSASLIWPPLCRESGSNPGVDMQIHLASPLNVEISSVLPERQTVAAGGSCTPSEILQMLCPTCLEIACRARGFDVIFLPKYNCELNFIEQCWGYAKRIYRHKTRSSSEAALERIVVESLDAITQSSMRR
jgi:hypothetical protein